MVEFANVIATSTKVTEILTQSLISRLSNLYFSKYLNIVLNHKIEEYLNNPITTLQIRRCAWISIFEEPNKMPRMYSDCT